MKVGKLEIVLPLTGKRPSTISVLQDTEGGLVGLRVQSSVFFQRVIVSLSKKEKVLSHSQS